MRILWFPRLQADIDRFHRVTWRKMAEVLQEEGHTVRVAVAGAPQADELQSLTGSGGAFEVYVPLPDAMPTSGTGHSGVLRRGNTTSGASTRYGLMLLARCSTGSPLMSG